MQRPTPDPERAIITAGARMDLPHGEPTYDYDREPYPLIRSPNPSTAVVLASYELRESGYGGLNTHAFNTLGFNELPTTITRRTSPNPERAVLSRYRPGD